MTRDQARAALPILQAFAQGKQLQVQPCRDSVWMDSEPAADWIFQEPQAWRIKPEPREWWVPVHKSGSFGSLWANRSELERFMKHEDMWGMWGTIIHVREVCA